jgi:hypothetical protein
MSFVPKENKPAEYLQKWVDKLLKENRELNELAAHPLSSWVDVKDEMPQDGDIVYGWREGLLFALPCHYRAGRFYRHVDVGEGDRITALFYPDLTHWHRLPQPPQDKA